MLIKDIPEILKIHEFPLPKPPPPRTIPKKHLLQPRPVPPKLGLTAVLHRKHLAPPPFIPLKFPIPYRQQQQLHPLPLLILSKLNLRQLHQKLHKPIARDACGGDECVGVLPAFFCEVDELAQRGLDLLVGEGIGEQLGVGAELEEAGAVHVETVVVGAV